MKKVVALVLCVIMVLSLAACGATEPKNEGGNNSDIAWEDSSVKVAIEADPGTFGPYETNNNGRRQVLPEIFEALGMYQGHGDTVTGVMAKKWYPTEGKENTYTIEIYDYITDSNGNQITADDIIFSYTEGASTYKRYLKAMESITKIDDYTLEIKLKTNELAALEHIMALCWIVDEDSYTSDADKMAYTPVGTGPYKFVSNVEGSSVTVVARDDYWQKDESLLVNNQFRNVKNIEFLVVKESAQKSNMLKTGEIDIVSGMTYEQAKNFMEDPEYTVDSTLDQKARTLVFNCNEASVCSNLDLRQAICYAVDAAGVLAGFDDAGELAWAIGNSTYPDVLEKWKEDGYYEQDLDKAKELLKKSGVAEGTTIRILTDNSEMNGTIATIIQGYLTQIGLNTEIMAYEQTLTKTYMRDFTSFDIYLVYNGNADFAVPMWQERLTNTSYDDGLNYCGINDSELQKLIDTAITVNGHTEENITALHNYIKDNALIYALFSPYIYTVANKNMTEEWLTEGMWLVPGCCKYVWNK